MRIHPQMKMIDLVSINYDILIVLQRLKIPFGFKDKSVASVCEENNVDVNFFLALNQWFQERDDFPDELLRGFPPHWLVSYLQETHSYYTSFQIPRLQKDIEELGNITNFTDQSAQLMARFFKTYISEFLSHLEEEEKRVFPYILDLEKVVKENGDIVLFMQKYGGYSIGKYLVEHTNLEEKAFDLQNILIKYVPPSINSFRFTNLILELYKLGKDLKDHTKLEESVLTPAVKELEKVLRKITDK